MHMVDSLPCTIGATSLHTMNKMIQTKLILMGKLILMAHLEKNRFEVLKLLICLLCQHNFEHNGH